MTVSVPFSVDIAPNADPARAGTWAWTDVTGDRRKRAAIEIKVGRADEAEQVDASEASVLFNNRHGKFSPRNPAGPWYGKLRANTPLRVRVRASHDTFTRVSATGLGTSDTGQTWTHSNPARWSVDGTAGVVTFPTANIASIAALPGGGAWDCEVTYSARISAVPAGASWVSGALLRYRDGANFIEAYTEFSPGGTISVRVGQCVDNDIQQLSPLTATGLTYAAGTKVWTKAQTLGATVSIKVWIDGTPEPSAWTHSYDARNMFGAGVGLRQWRINGETTPGTMTMTIDDWHVEAIRMAGPVPEWPARWDKSGADCWTPVTATGPLRWLLNNRKVKPKPSPLTRMLTAQNPTGYWRMEDGSTARSASAAISGGAAATVAGGEFGQDDCPGGAASALQLKTAADSYVIGRVTQWRQAQDGYACLAYLRVPVLPAAKTPVMEVAADGYIVRWVIYYGPTAIYVDGFTREGVLAINESWFYELDPTRWMAVQLSADEAAGGIVNWRVIWHQVGTLVSSFRAGSGSFSGTANRINSAIISAPVADTMVSHLWIGRSTSIVTATFRSVSSGYAFETASDRIARVCADAGISALIMPGESEQLGPQKSATTVDVLRESERTDLGVLFEAGAGYGYLPRGARYNAPVGLALNWAGGGLAEAPEPTDDEQRFANSVTVTRDDEGGSALYEDRAHIAKYGFYEQEVSVSLPSDARLNDHAEFRVHLGTVDELRWPRITVNLVKHPELIPAWLACRIGSRITIANPLAQVAGADIDLLLEGWHEIIGEHQWTVELFCSPASPWRAGVWDAATSRYDADTSTLAVARAAVPIGTVQSWTVTTPRWWDQWDNTSLPLRWMVGGEEITVTALTAPNPSTSTIGPFQQTATVTRGVGGVTVNLPAGAAVRLADPVHYAL